MKGRAHSEGDPVASIFKGSQLKTEKKDMGKSVNGAHGNFQNKNSKLPYKQKPLVLLPLVWIKWPQEEQKVSLFENDNAKVCKSTFV